MRLLSRFLLPLVLPIALAGVSAVARAQSQPPEPELLRRDSGNPTGKTNRSSMSDSVRRAQRETGGQVLGAERVQYDGREINRIKVMDDRGRVRYMDDDPQRARSRPSYEDPRRERDSRDDRGRGTERPEYTPRARRDNPHKP